MHRAIFIPTLGRAVEDHQSADPFFDTAGITGIGVIDRTAFILVESAHAGQLIESIFCCQLVEVVENAIVLELILCKGDVIIEIEIAAF